jgi:NTE family protein
MIAFVLSGGGSLGAIQAGMLRALYERGIAPELILGTSAGAVNGAYIASRPQTVETSAALAEVWRGLRAFEVFPPNPVTAVLGLVGLRDHLVPNIGLRALAERYLEFESLEDAAIPLRLIATDIRSGAEVRMSSGDAASAVLASAAIPGVYPAIDRDGAVLVDGGVSNNTPISDAAELGATQIYVLPTGGTCRLSTAPQGAVQMLVHAITLLINQRLVADIEHFSHDAELIVLPPPCPLDVLPSDFSDADRLIKQGHRLAARALDHADPAGYATPLALKRLRPHSR